MKILIVTFGGAVLLAGCGATPNLSTGSLFGAKPAQQGPKPTTPTDRAIYVGSTSARAQRCGFYFDANQLKSNYLAAETQGGTAPADVQKAEQAYNLALTRVAGSIANNADYCTELQNMQIKTALTKQLAGDFNPPVKKVVTGGGIFDTFDQSTRRDRDKFNAEEILERSKGAGDQR